MVDLDGNPLRTQRVKSCAAEYFDVKNESTNWDGIDGIYLEKYALQSGEKYRQRYRRTGCSHLAKCCWGTK